MINLSTKDTTYGPSLNIAIHLNLPKRKTSLQRTNQLSLCCPQSARYWEVPLLTYTYAHTYIHTYIHTYTSCKYSVYVCVRMHSYTVRVHYILSVVLFLCTPTDTDTSKVGHIDTHECTYTHVHKHVRINWPYVCMYFRIEAFHFQLTLTHKPQVCRT